MRTFFTLLALVISGTLFAAEDDARFALVMGNSAYDGDAALANAANDANDMAAALGNIGWKVTKLINGDRKAMNRTLVAFRDDMAKATNPSVLFFYAGHGVQINGQNYLIPVKETFETPDDVIQDALGLQDVVQAFEDAKVAVDIIILDACRDNPFAKKNSRSLGGTRGLTVVNKSPTIDGSAILFSTAPGETASDGNGRNGVFTQALLKYIDSDLTLQQISTRVTKDVKTATGGKQSPYNSMSLSDDFYLLPVSMRSKAPVLTPAPAITSAPATTPAHVAVTKPIAPKSSGGGSLLPLIGFGTGGVAAAVAGACYYLGAKAYADYRSATVASQASALNAQVGMYSTGLVAAAATAGLGLVVGVVSMVLDGGSR
ncbi:MAG: caspase family protein [Spirochaetales bacterium]